MVRPIVTFPSPILTTPSQVVTIFDNALKRLADDMVETMRKAPGVGLAAPQVGINLRVVVVEYNPSNDEEPRGPRIPLIKLINPVITHLSKGKDVLKEGCLSIPKVEVPVKRSKKVKVVAQDITGQSIKFRASGFFARILQHEVDHVNGILITDRANNNKTNYE